MSSAAAVVVFYQAAPARRAASTVPQASAGSEVPTSQRTRADVDEALQVPLSETGALITLALRAVNLTETQASKEMGISLTLFCRQLRNLDN